MHKELYGWDKGGKAPKKKENETDTFMAIVIQNRRNAKKRGVGMVTGLASFDSGSHSTMSSGLGTKRDSYNLVH
jgi:hypothetical protein